MDRMTTGILLAIYGILGGLCETFLNYFIFISGNALMQTVMLILNPLFVLRPASYSGLIMIGIYPYAVIVLGLYMTVSSKKKKRLISKRAHR